MDSLSILVEKMRLTGSIFLDAEFTAPWCVTSSIGPDDCVQFVPLPRNVIAFHYVSKGRLLTQVNDQTPMAVGRGEIVLFPRNDKHYIGSQLDIAAVKADSLIKPGNDGGLAEIRYGGGGETTHIICGFLGTDQQQDPLLAMLPPVIRLKVRQGALGDWVESSFKLAAKELSVGSLKNADMLTHLAEFLFKDTVRRFSAGLPVGSGKWRQGLHDERVASALVMLHEQLDRRWTAECLAAEVGLSRSAFAERFQRLIGESPMRYLAKQRLWGAAEHLKSGSESVARVAFRVGYESEAAFNRAFKREFGLPPATWRKQNQDEVDNLPRADQS